MKYSVKSLLLLTLVCAVATFAIGRGSEFSGKLFLSLGIVVFAVSLIGALHTRGTSRAWWSGQAIGMGLYGLALKLGLGAAMPWHGLLEYLAREGKFYESPGARIFINGNLYHPVMLSIQVAICLAMGILGGLVARYFHRTNSTVSVSTDND